MANLSGRVAIITGASKGIGAAIAEKLAGDGAAVAVNFSNSAWEADTVVENIQKRGGRALAVRADVSKLADVKKLFETTVQAYGHVHVLVNNAAVYSPAPFEKIDEQFFDRHFSLNVKGLFFSIQEAVNLFGDAGGSIITLARSPRSLPDPTWSSTPRRKPPSTPSPRVLQLSSVLRRS
jgi:3-oxoacyl-[acyl-carrier protein] reductase